MIHLATTRLQAFWPDGDPVTLLGRWCVPENDLWTPRESAYRIAPYPWDDRDRFLAAARQVDALAEQLLPPLAAALDRQHGISGGPRYWRIIVGPWLAWYLEALCDRYTCLRDVIDHAGGPEGVRSVGLDAADFVVPATMADFSRLYVDDAYNLQWYSRLLESMGVRCPRRRLPSASRMVAGLPPRRDARAWVRRAQAWRIRRAEGLVVGAAMNGEEHRAWSSRTAGRIGGMLEMPDVSAAAAVSDSARAEIRRSLPVGSDLEGVAAALVPADLPTAYLEAFRPETGPRPRLVVSGTGWVADERFKRIAAAAQSDGARLVAVQHGGYYGMLAAHSPECHEQRVADEYVTAGWDDTLVPGTSVTSLPMPSLGRQTPREARGGILLVTTMHPRYLYRLQSHPVGPQWAEYLRMGVAFADALGPEARARLRVCLYPHTYGWAVERAWRALCPGVDARPSEGNLHAAMAAADLVVIDHPGTAMLEAAAANHPHVVFWDPRRFEMRPSAAQACDVLRAAGILAGTPGEAAALVTAAARDVAAWWAAPGRQAAITAFRAQYARSDREWPAVWHAYLTRQLSAGRAS